tara:strand:- start:270 stop:623 length:354 start_codon:yes stop_codon:yes gene_type:complete
MTLILTILSLILNGYLFYLLKKLTKKLDSTLKDFSYLSNELDVKINELDFEVNKLDAKIISDKQDLLQELKHINKVNQNQNTNLHKQLISKEFEKFKSDIDKTLKDMIKNVENIKIY